MSRTDRLLELVIHLSILLFGFSSSQDFFSTVDPVLNQVLKCRPNIPGMSVSVVQNGQVLMSKGYGISDVVNKGHVTNETLFQIASLTKAFTSALLVKQTDKLSNVSIYSKVVDVIGNNFHFASDLLTQQANIRDLMSHTLAIPSNNAMRLDLSLTRANYPSRVEKLQSIYHSGFRASFVYSNLNYGLLTYISEKLGKDTWENLIQREIFDQLGMTSSSFMTRDNSGRDVASGYKNGPNGTLVSIPNDFSRHYATMCGSGCIMSTSNDMAKWMNFHLSGGLNEQGVQVIKTKTLDLTHSARNSIRGATIEKYFSQPQVPVSTTESNYAAGWKNGHYRGYRILRHTGSTFGYRALLTLFPDMKIGIFTALNGDDPNYIFRTLIHNYIADVALGVNPWLNASTICSFPRPWYNKSISSSYKVIDKTYVSTRSLPKYEGTYTNEAYGTLNVTLNMASNRLILDFGIGTWTLYPKKYRNQFAGEADGLLKNIYDIATIKFVETPDSGITAVEITSFQTSSPPVFTRIVPSHSGIAVPIIG